MSRISPNSNEQEREKTANKDLLKKLALEPLLERDLIKLFNRISKAGQILYGATGRKINVFNFKDEMASILARHYRRVFKVFNNPFEIDLQSALNIGSKDAADDRIKKQQDDYIDVHSDQQAQIIANSTQNRWNDSIKVAITALLFIPTSSDQNQDSVDGPSPLDASNPDSVLTPSGVSNDEIAREASGNFDNTTPGRSSTIATTETQNAAETNKGIIAVVTAAVAGLLAKKTWISVLDKRERPAHGQAHGQSQPLGTPYLVGGELLQYPGDVTLGASVGNIANCRCASVYSLLGNPFRRRLPPAVLRV